MITPGDHHPDDQRTLDGAEHRTRRAQRQHDEGRQERVDHLLAHPAPERHPPEQDDVRPRRALLDGRLGRGVGDRIAHPAPTVASSSTTSTVRPDHPPSLWRARERSRIVAGTLRALARAAPNEVTAIVPTAKAATAPRYDQGRLSTSGGGSNTPARTLTSVADSAHPPRAPRTRPATRDVDGLGPHEPAELARTGPEGGDDGQGAPALGQAQGQQQARRGRREDEGEAELHLGEPGQVDGGEAGADRLAGRADVGHRGLRARPPGGPGRRRRPARTPRRR